MLFYKCVITCVLCCLFSTVFIRTTESHIYSDNNDKLKLSDYNETLSPVIVELNTLSPCSINVSWSCDQCADFGLSEFIVYWSGGTDGNFEVNDMTFYYVINGLDAATNYSVIVSAVYEDNNEYESNTDYAPTEAGDPPDIDYINIEIITSTTIKLSWNTTNQECPIEKYDVQYAGPVLCTAGRTDSGGEITPETSTTLTGLIPYTEYNITIAAIATDDTYGNVNFMEDVITDEDVPGTPEKLVSVPLNSSSMDVSWEQPLECNGILLDYTVSWKLVENDTIVESDTTPELTYQVDNLLECGEYEFFVNANTSKGIGNAATTSSSTLPEVPPPVGSFGSESVTSRSANLSWTPPDTHCPYNYILDLTGTVLWDDQVVTDEVIVPGSETFYEVDDLVPWTNYSVCITATTEGGSSEPICTEFQTLQDAPSVPTKLMNDVLSTSEVMLSWEPPEMLNGELLHYTINWGTEDDTDEVAADVMNYTIAGLSACVKYTVSVTGATEVGEGEPAITKPVMDAEKPGEIDFLECGTATSTTLQVGWGKPNTTCEVTYTVSAVGSILWNGSITYHIESTNNENITLTGLVPDTMYQTTITPQTEAGAGKPGLSCVMATKEDVPGIPENLTVVEESITSEGFKITWNEPIVKNGQITRFKVTLNNGEPNFVNYEEPGTTYETTFNDLSFSDNVVDVFAETSVDFGPPAEVRTTLQDDSDLGLILGITIPLIVIIIVASVIGYCYRDNIRTRVESFRS